ncbi:hypothetical protein B0H10DRAFT_2060419 [Mycena sp. CBHHK59/15]|nr:hypothetical protein B0H10DRAFT_2060419 [Mycena sp. CBHHK59/15]
MPRIRPTKFLSFIRETRILSSLPQKMLHLSERRMRTPWITISSTVVKSFPYTPRTLLQHG